MDWEQLHPWRRARARVVQKLRLQACRTAVCCVHATASEDLKHLS